MTIFENVVRNEVDFTEVFRNLCHFTAFRDVVSDWLYEGFTNTLGSLTRPQLQFAADEIQTQVVDGKASSVDADKCRPDIMIRTSEAEIILELKVYTYRELTASQPELYLNRLARTEDDSAGRVKLLAFIVPDHYAHEREIKLRDQEWRSDWTKKKKNGEVPVPEVAILRWEKLIKMVKDKGLHDLSQILGQFVEFGNDWFPENSVSLSDADVRVLKDTTVGAAIQNAYSVVDSVRELLKKSGSFKLSNRTSNEHDYSVYLSSQDGERVGYFGFSFHDWEANGYQFLLGLPSKREIPDTTTGLKELYEEDNLTFFGITERHLGSNALSDLIWQFFGSGRKAPSSDGAKGLDDADFRVFFHEKNAAATFSKMITLVSRMQIALQSHTGDKGSFSSSVNEYSVICPSGNPPMYLGLFYNNWTENGNPLWIGVEKARKSLLADGHFNEQFDEDDWHYKAVDLDKATKREDLFDYLSEIIADCSGKLK